jgi:hypothetical protein
MLSTAVKLAMCGMPCIHARCMPILHCRAMPDRSCASCETASASCTALQRTLVGKSKAEQLHRRHKHRCMSARAGSSGIGRPQAVEVQPVPILHKGAAYQQHSRAIQLPLEVHMQGAPQPSWFAPHLCPLPSIQSHSVCRAAFWLAPSSLPSHCMSTQYSPTHRTSLVTVASMYSLTNLAPYLRKTCQAGGGAWLCSWPQGTYWESRGVGGVGRTTQGWHTRCNTNGHLHGVLLRIHLHQRQSSIHLRP